MKLPADKVSRLRSAYAGKSVCVTGGTGFIGGHLVDALVSMGANVRVIDDLSNSTLEHLAGLIELEPERARFTHGSVLDDEAVAQAIGGSHYVFHPATPGSFPKTTENPQRTRSAHRPRTLPTLQTPRP